MTVIAAIQTGGTSSLGGLIGFIVICGGLALYMLVSALRRTPEDEPGWEEEKPESR